MSKFMVPNFITDTLLKCTEDLREIAMTSTVSLDAQVRGYDLLDALLSEEENLREAFEDSFFKMAAFRFLEEYGKVEPVLNGCFNEDALKKEASARMQIYEQNLAVAEKNAVSAVELHQLAKDTYQIWQTAGVFARHRALNVLRRRAGFRLESHRIGNYVAKTYDLMESARREYQKAQQCLFSSNVMFKINPGTFARIAGLLT